MAAFFGGVAPPILTPTPTTSPNHCLICYSKLTNKLLKSREINLRIQEATVAKDVVFVLKILLNIPQQLLEKFLEETRAGPGGWINICDECIGGVAQAKIIYQEIYKIMEKFKDVQKTMTEKLKNSEEEKKKYMKTANKQQLARMMVTDTCRKFVNERSYFQAVVGDDPFTVEDVTAVTYNLLTKLSSAVNNQQQQVILLINPGAPVPEFVQVNQVVNPTPTPTVTVQPQPQASSVLNVTAPPASSVLNVTAPPASSVLNVTAPPPSRNRRKSRLVPIPEVIENDPLSILPDNNEDSNHDNDDDIKEEIEIKSEELEFEDEGSVTSEVGDFEGDTNDSDSEWKPEIVNNLSRTHEKKIRKSWTCSEEGCDGKKFNSSELYRKHMDYHKKENAKTRYKCKLCEAAFSLRNQLTSHLVKEHGTAPENRKNPKNLTSDPDCKICQSKHINADLLRIHIRTHHKNQKVYMEPEKYPCHYDNCSKVFSQPSSLQIHISRHEHKPGFKCDLCEDLFYSLQERSIHKDKVHSGLEFKCEFCSKMFTTNQHLQGHRITTHKAPKLEYLEGPSSKKVRKQTPDKPQVRETQQGSSKVKEPSGPGVPQDPFRCHICGKKLLRKSSLQIHLKVRHEEKKFKCDHCEMTFTFQNNLTRHQSEIHGIGEIKKRFQCGVIGCRRVFWRQEALDLHKKKEHGETGNEKNHQLKTHKAKKLVERMPRNNPIK